MGHAGLLAVVIVALSDCPGHRCPVRPGLDVLLSDSLHLVSGRRVGLVANNATIDRTGTHAVDRLRAAGVRLVALFSPEHGFRGTADPGEAVAASVDSATGLPIYSLYGSTRAPTEAMLRDVDVLLIDLPDVGTRYFTYLSTTIEVMRVAAARKLPLIILDRPDPIGGAVQGNVLDSAFRSFIGAHTLPMRHGMTLGELARMIDAEVGIGARLAVVPVSGWRRARDIIDARLPFIPPSPNLRTIESLFHYPGMCLFEGTTLSVGRGTDHPFEQIGAPWLDTTAVLAIVRKAGLRGVRFAGVTFTPDRPGDGKHAGVQVNGIRLVLTDRQQYEPIRTAVVILAALRPVHGSAFGFIAAHFDRLAGGSSLREAIEANESPDRIVARWQPDLERFIARRKPYLLYR